MIIFIGLFCNQRFVPCRMCTRIFANSHHSNSECIQHFSFLLLFHLLFYFVFIFVKQLFNVFNHILPKWNEMEEEEIEKKKTINQEPSHVQIWNAVVFCLASLIFWKTEMLWNNKCSCALRFDCMRFTFCAKGSSDTSVYVLWVYCWIYTAESWLIRIVEHPEKREMEKK